MATLKLTLSKKPFDVMRTGEKTTEFRRMSKWMTSRLYNKNGVLREYKYVEFVNGYGATKPRFTVEFKGVEIINDKLFTYSNGLKVDITEPTYAINLGDALYESSGCE